ncbi:MAG TPA: DUF4034 domain-containing protein [Thermoanaerobaculia bacterium]|nr:DUF4034 domain-containing protein [Thermoanaerobaculia bacterium]
MKIAFIVMAVAILGCARTRREKESDVSYEMRGRKTIGQSTGAPPAPAFIGRGIIAPTPRALGALPRFGAETPIPAVLPAFVGSAIRGPDGHAPQTADKLVLLALLKARRFGDLDRCFEDYQTAFELDARNEYWPTDALEAFRTADAGIGMLVGDWVDESPKPWAAFAARGAQRHALAWSLRGGGYADTVSDAVFAEFHRHEIAAAEDLRKAIKRRPRFIAAHYVLIQILRGSPAARRVLDEALEACPECFQPRAAYLDALSPKWGGSYEEMEAFVREAIASNPSPRLKLLRGFILTERAAQAMNENNPAQAMAFENEALGAGEHWGALYRRAVIASSLGQPAAALIDLDRAFELRPQAASLADFRAQVRAKLGQVELAIQDFDLARRLDPARPRPEQYAQLADTLVRRSNDALATGGTERAGALRTLADNLKSAAAPPGAAAPYVPLTPTAEVFTDPGAALRAQIASLPDDYAAYRRLGFPLLNARRSQELEELWTSWVQKHPDDPRGYWERHTAYSQRRDFERRDEDLRQACTLGHAEACRTQEINAALRARRAGER